LVCEIPIGAQWDSTSFSKVSSADFYYCELKHQNLVWVNAKSSSLWSPPLPVKSDFAVAAIVLSDSNGNIVQAATKRLSSTDAAIGEA